MRNIDKLRKKMQECGLDAYVSPSSDPHLSEYLPDYYKERAFLTGFTGSNGLAVTTLEEGKMWTDGRYFIQAANQIKDSGYDLMKMATKGYPTYDQWLFENLKNGSKLGLNALYFSKTSLESLKQKLSDKKIELVDIDLVKDIWTENRQALSNEKAFLLEEKFAGKSAGEKLKEIRKILEKENCDYLVLGDLPDICWLFNIRAFDILYTPVLISYALVGHDRAVLFTSEEKIDEKTRTQLLENSIELRRYEDIFDFLKNLKAKRIMADPNRLNSKVYDSISCEVVNTQNPTEKLKSVKNATEISNLKEAYLRDCVALTKYFYFLKTRIKHENLNEFSAQEILHDFRAQDDMFIEESFGTISAYASNAAMMHYSASEKANRKLEPKSLYLVDSGGQYYLGTTDITRTLALGDISDEEKKDFTLVLKSHLNLASFKFLEGTSGHALDAIAREPLWREGLDYKCGTGHGVGYLLGVHEGPHGISPRPALAPLLPGCVVTIEPGIYKENKHGIRLENDYYIEYDLENENGQFMRFEVLNYLPFDLDAIDVDLLTENERRLLNDYHRKTYELLSPHLDGEIKVWLEHYTRPI